MGSFDESKKYGTKAYPVEASITSSLLRRCEAIITPELLKSSYMKNVDLSNYSEQDLKREIMLAMNETELFLNVPLTKVQYTERIPFDRAAYKSFVYFKTNNGPILSLEDLSIVSSNGEQIYSLPPTWIEMGLAHKRQVNLVPILSIFGAAGLRDGQASNAGLIFLQAVNNYRWLPAFYTVKYTVGVSHTEGQLPVVLNDVVGMTAAIKILSEKQAEEKYKSTSISQDGISQTAAGAGEQRYKTRIEDLTMRKDKMLSKIKAEFHQKYFLSNI